MITKLDDYPIHQTAEPIKQTASSDRFTYDRFWYNGFSKDGSFYFGVGLGRYPNLGIQDCGFSLVIDGKQYAFHGSRREPNEPTDLTIGPFELQVLEPLGKHRLVIAPNETGIECDLTFTPRTGAIEEKRQTLRNERHLVMDATRFDQFGCWEGSIKYDGKELIVNKETALGIKDRSWGIRPVGAAYEGGAPSNSFQPVHFMWLPIHWENRCTLAGWFEDETGFQWHTDQAISTVFDKPETSETDNTVTYWDGKVGFKLELEKGTRRATSGSFRMNDKSGESLEVTIEPLLLFRMKGLGYLHSEWGHGKWQGELAISGESWNCDEVDPLSLDNIHIQQVVIVRHGDEVGYGVLEQLHIGPHKNIGFEDWFDGAS
ncbi:MAG: hypothetical protein KAG18_05485 [Sinobacterium sp.]|nr:hypothetical protein [Sinobacterium sp.]